MPSLYESTANTGEVSSSNFTTLYNASGLLVPNAGAGSITGNLNVGGNLTVQGSSLLIGEVTLQSTLSLPNYTFPLPDGSTDQVLVTDGNGNLYWTDVSAIPGADYSISATTATGGANLTLANTAGFTDSVKLAAGTNMSIVRTDANTITIATVADNIPDGTANGQVLVWQNSAWTANNTIRSNAAGNRLVATYENAGAGPNSALFVRKDYTATNYSSANNDGVGINFSLASTAQGISSYGVLNYEYSATDPQFTVGSSIDNFATTGTTTLLLDKSTLNLYAPNITLNKDQTGVPSLNASITAERGSSTNATITWDEADDRWELNYELLAPGLQGGNVQIGYSGGDNEIYIGGEDLEINTDGSHVIQSNSPIQTTAQSMSINSDNTAADSFLYLKGTTEFLKWNNTDTRFEFSDQLYISQAEPPAVFERRTSAADTSPYELKAGLKLINRVTDAANNDVVNTGPTVIFGRTSGASDPTERVFAGMGSAWDGATGTAQLQFTWTNDNFSEPTPGNFPGTYTLLRLESDDSTFYNNSLFIDYSAAGLQQTATSITGGNTLVFPSAHGFVVGERVKYMSTTQNGLTQFNFYYVIAAGFTTTQCRLGLTSTGTAIALTNGTGLTLNFAELINQVGINTGTPNYTLDVNGELNVSSIITVQGDAITVNSDKTDQDVYVNFGRVAPSANAAIRWNATTDSFEWSEDSSTWHDFIDATITNPQQGQLLTYDAASTEWINSSLIVFNDTTYRPNFQQKSGVYGRTSSGAAVSNNTGVVPYSTADGSSFLMGIDSDSQSLAFIGSLSTAYNTTGDHEIRLSTSTNNFVSDKITSITGGNTLVFSAAHNFTIGDKLTYASPTTNGLVYGTSYYVIAAGFTTTQCQVSLTLGGSAVALTNGTGLSLYMYNGTNRLVTVTNATLELSAPTILLNAVNTGIPFTGTAGIEVERGTTGANQYFNWNETFDFWNASGDLYVDNIAIGGVALATNGNNIYYNNENTNPPGDCNLIVKSGVSAGVDANFRWNDTTNRWQDTIDGTNYFNLPNQNLDTNSAVSFSEVSIDGVTTYNSQTTTTTSTAATAISSTSRASQKSVIRIVDNVTGAVHMLEALAFFQGSTAYLTTYAEMYSSAALATFTATYSGGFVNIIATPASANSTTFTVARVSLD